MGSFFGNLFRPRRPVRVLKSFLPKMVKPWGWLESDYKELRRKIPPFEKKQ